MKQRNKIYRKKILLLKRDVVATKANVDAISASLRQTFCAILQFSVSFLDSLAETSNIPNIPSVMDLFSHNFYRFVTKYRCELNAANQTPIFIVVADLTPITFFSLII